MKTLRRCFVFALAFYLLAGCVMPDEEAFITPSTTPAILTSSGSSDPSSDPLVLTPENVRNIDLLHTYGQGRILGFALSPDGNSIAYSTITGVYLYDLATKETKRLVSPPEQFWSDTRNRTYTALAFTSDGDQLAIASKVGVYLISLVEEQDILPFYPLSNNTVYPIWKIAFSADDTKLIVFNRSPRQRVCNGEYQDMHLVDLPSGRILYMDILCGRYSTNYRFTANKELFLPGWTGNYEEIEGALVLDAVSGSVKEKLNLFPGKSDFVSFNETGTQAIVQEHLNGKRSLIDLDSGEEVMEFTDDAVHVSNSEYLLELKDNSLIIRNDQLDMVCNIPKPKSMEYGISIARQEIQRDYLAYLDEDNTIFVIDIATCETIAVLQVETASLHQYSYVEPQRKEYFNPLYSIGSKVLIKDEDGIKLCLESDSDSTPEACKRIDLQFIPIIYIPSNDFSLVVLTNRYSHAILNTNDETVVNLQRFSSHVYGEDSHELYGADFSPDKRLFVATTPFISADKLLVWEVATGNLLLQTELPTSASLAWFSPDGTKIYITAGSVIYELGLPTNAE
ncbi:MAG: hypothetical protein ACOYKC_07490 [Anaerolineaceae bacterium]|jgi:WD40 repeat protein